MGTMTADWAAAHKFHTEGIPTRGNLCPLCEAELKLRVGDAPKEETAEERQKRIWACRTYADSDPQVNKLRYVTDMLERDPSFGPRLIDALLWTGEFAPDGTPIVTPPLALNLP